MYMKKKKAENACNMGILTRGGGGKRSCTSRASCPKGGGKVKGTGSGGGRAAQRTEPPGLR